MSGFCLLIEINTFQSLAVTSAHLAEEEDTGISPTFASDSPSDTRKLKLGTVIVSVQFDL